MSIHDTAFVRPEHAYFYVSLIAIVKNFLRMILISICSMLVGLREEVLKARDCAKAKVGGHPSCVCFL